MKYLRQYLRHFSGLPPACWRGIILTLLEATAGGISFFLALYFVKVLHLSIETATLLISSYGIGRVVGGLLGGRLSDSVPPRLVTIASLLTQACTYSLLIFVRDPRWIAPILFAQGIGVYAFQASNNLVVIKAATDSTIKVRAINILYNAANVGLGLSAIIVSVFFELGFHNLFFLTAAIFFSVAVYLIWHSARAGLGPAPGAEPDEQRTESSTVRDPRKAVMGLSLACLLFVGLMSAQLGTTYSTFLMTRFPEMGVRGVGFLFTLNSALVVFCQAPLVGRFERSNTISMMGIGAFLFAAGMFMLVLPVGFWIAIVSCVVFTLGEMIFMTMAQVVCYDHSAHDAKGRGLGFYQATSGVSMVVGPAVGGWIYGGLGSSALWYASGIVGVLCLLACNHYKKHDRNAANAAPLALAA